MKQQDAALPDFIGIGAQKAGTTWLGHNLQLHPGVWMPEINELHYFNDRINDPKNPFTRLYDKIKGGRTVDRRWRRQVKSRIQRYRRNFSEEDFLWNLKYYAGAPDDEWYASLFEAGQGKVKGEITPAYSMLDRESIAHVHSLVPDAKLIFMMRNPIERAWSQVVMWFDKSGNDMASAQRRRLKRNFESEGSRSRTDYLRTLENWSEFYPENRIFVGFLEDIHFYPEELLKSVYDFLSVDPTFEPEGVGEKVHSRSAGNMPTESAVYLARLYEEELSRLDESFGGYASFWRYCAKRFVEGPLEQENTSYPLWNSFLWKEWLGAQGESPEKGSLRTQLQSGPLSSMRFESEGR